VENGGTSLNQRIEVERLVEVELAPLKAVAHRGLDYRLRSQGSYLVATCD
jgi:hypothetical protein